MMSSKTSHNPDPSKQPAQSPARLTYLLPLIFLIISSALLWQWLSNPQRFPIRHVQVSARFTHMAKSHLQKEIAPFVTTSFFAMPISALKQHLHQLPWVSEVSVRRLWPDQVRVSITEKKAKAVWNHEALLTDQAVLFTPTQSVVTDVGKTLPQLIGIKQSHVMMMQVYHRLSQILTPLGLRITQLTYDKGHRWTVVTSTLTLRAGALDLPGLFSLVQRFAHFYPAFLRHIQHASHTKHQHDLIDLRYPDGFSLSKISALSHKSLKNT